MQRLAPELQDSSRLCCIHLAVKLLPGDQVQEHLLNELARRLQIISICRLSSSGSEGSRVHFNSTMATLHDDEILCASYQKHLLLCIKIRSNKCVFFGLILLQIPDHLLPAMFSQPGADLANCHLLCMTPAVRARICLTVCHNFFHRSWTCIQSTTLSLCVSKALPGVIRSC